MWVSSRTCDQSCRRNYAFELCRIDLFQQYNSIFGQPRHKNPHKYSNFHAKKKKRKKRKQKQSKIMLKIYCPDVNKIVVAFAHRLSSRLLYKYAPAILAMLQNATAGEKNPMNFFYLICILVYILKKPRRSLPSNSFMSQRNWILCRREERKRKREEKLAHLIHVHARAISQSHSFRFFFF